MKIRWNGASGVLEGEVVRSWTEHLVKLPNGKYVLVDSRSITESINDNQNEQI